MFIRWSSGDLSNTETVFAFPADSATESYIGAILHLPIAFYFNALTGIILLGDLVKQRQLPGTILPNFNVPFAKMSKRSSHDRFRPPYGQAIEYFTSIGYGDEVGLPAGMQEVYDPYSRKSLILDHRMSKLVLEDFRPVPKGKPLIKPTVISLGNHAKINLPPGVCTQASIVKAASQRARSKPIGCTLIARGQNGVDGISGKEGSNGGDGANGASGNTGFLGAGAKRNGQHGHDGQRGGEGGNGGRGGNGTNGCDVLVILSGSADELQVKGSKEFKVCLGDDKSLVVDCRGGNGGKGGCGGKGGSGGSGGNGGKGAKGNSPLVGARDGGDGGNGGHGGDGGNGGRGGDSGNGGDAGHGGSCVIETADPRLLMLVEVDCMQGEPGAGVKGGAGGDGGKPGKGGKGGPGGDGNTVASSYTDSSGAQRTVIHRGYPGYDGNDGRNGDRGRSGPSGVGGKNGKSGVNGGILWVIKSAGKVWKSSSRYDAVVESFKVTPTLNDGIFEPNESIIVSGLVVHSIGGFNLPCGTSVLIPSTPTIKFESSRFNFPHPITAGKKYTIPFNFKGRIVDASPPNTPGHRELEMAQFCTRIEVLGRPFERSFLRQKLKVQYPVQLGKLCSPKLMDRGEVALISVEVKNLSKLPYGSCSGSGGRVVLHLHFDSRISPIAANTEGPYVVRFDSNLRDSTFIELSKIPPQKEVTVAIKVQIANCADLFDHCLWQVDLRLRDKLIEYNHQSIRITPAYSPQEIPADALLITNEAVTRNEFAFWHNTFESLDVSYDIWDTELYNGLSIDSRTGMRHENSWYGRYTGKMIVYPHCNLQLLAGEDIALHFNGEKFHDELKELESSLILFMPVSGSQHQNERAVLKHLAVVNAKVEIPENAYGGRHLHEPCRSDDPPPYANWEKTFVKKLEEENFSQAPLLLTRQVDITSIGFMKYSYGSVDVRQIPVLKSSKFLQIYGAGDLDAHCSLPFSTHIPLGDKPGQAILATLHGIEMSAKLKLMKRRSQGKSFRRVFMLHPSKNSVLSREEVLMSILAWEVVDELFTCSGEALRMKEIYTDIMDHTDAYLEPGHIILSGLKLIEKEYKQRKSTGLKHVKAKEAYRQIKEMSTNIRKKFLEAGIKCSKLEDLISFEFLCNSNVHRYHQLRVKQGKWDLTT